MKPYRIAGPVAVAAIAVGALTACGPAATAASSSASAAAASASAASAAAAASSVAAAWATSGPAVAAAESSAAAAAAAESSAADAAAAAAAADAAAAAPASCTLQSTGDLIWWEKWPNLPAKASMLGSVDLTKCKPTVDTWADTAPSGPGYCDILASPSDNPGYNVNAANPPRPSHVLATSGEGC